MLSTTIQRLNERRDAAEETGEDAGFTLIELMVVLLIMAILLAIAIPTFLGVSSSANDRAAQSNLNTALTNAKSYYQNNSQAYATDTTSLATMLTALGSQEPSISWTSGASTTSGTVSVAVATDGNGITLAAPSKDGVCWYLTSNEAADSTWSANYQTGAGTWYGAAKTSTCNASSVPVTGTAAGNAHWNAAGSSGFPTAPAS
jgi:type IV pilus assembly protein PilA